MKKDNYYYHYTNEVASNNIKNTGILRFCQLGCSNDDTDCRYASYDLYHQALIYSLTHVETDSTEQKFIQYIIDNIDKFDLYRNEHTSIYGVCSCEDDNNEVLIRAYGNYTIKININGIMGRIKTDNPGCPTYWLRLNKVVYTESEYLDLVRRLLYKNIKDRMFYINYLIEGKDDCQEVIKLENGAIQLASKGIYSSVFSESSILYKSIGSQEEREHRWYIVENTYSDDILSFYRCEDLFKYITYIKDIGLHSTLKVLNEDTKKYYYEFKTDKFKTFITF